MGLPFVNPWARDDFDAIAQAQRWEKDISGATFDPRQDYTEHAMGAGHGSRTHWQFPSGLGQGDDGDFYHWMLITAYEIVGGFHGTKNVQFGNPSGSIALPIPPGIQATYAQNWGQMEIPVARGAAARALGTGIRGLLGDLGVMENLADEAVIGGAESGSVAGSQRAPEKDVEALAAIVKGTGMAEVMQFESGARVLNQVMLSYAGPTFREFTYSFSLKPNNANDSKEIDSLIKWLKFKSAPGQNVGRYVRAFRLPSVFRIQFFSGDSENERIPKIGYCVCKNIGTQYGGDIFRTFDDDAHSPVQVNLSLNFQEMEFLDRSSFMEDEDRSIKGDF